jgi:FkbM family methyltransferase
MAAGRAVVRRPGAGRLRRRIDRYLVNRVAEGVARSGRAAAEPAPPAVTHHGPHGAYIGDGRMLVTTIWGGKVIMPTSDLSLMPELVANGTYDVPFTAFVRQHLQPGGVAFDVGAHVGLFTLLMAHEVWETGHVVAYEANPGNVAILRDNVAMSYLLDRVEIVPKAAAAAPGQVEFLAPQRFQMMGSIRPIEEHLVSKDKADTIDRIQVEAEPLDVHAGRFERVDLIKIDVEGAEEQVFAGMAGLLDSGVVRWVAFELYRPLMGDDWEPFARRLKALESAGWSFATLPDSGIPESVALDAVLDRGWFSQVVMTSPGA